MKTRAWCVVRGAWLLVLASSAAAQTVEQRVAKAPDGSVRFSFAARPGVYGNGRNMISWDCDKGNCHNRQVDGNWDDHNDWDAPCDSGPVRVALTKSSGRITDLRVYVGGEWRPNTTATDLGTVGTKDAASYLGVSSDKLVHHRRIGQGPIYYHRSGRVEYRATDLDIFRLFGGFR